MPVAFNHIAYEALDVCNALSMAAVEEAVAATGLAAGARALDIGTGNAAVAIRLAERFGLEVEAVERDPQMADLAARRIAASPAGDNVTLTIGHSGDVLDRAAPWSLIVVIGATEAAAPGVREAEAVFRQLRARIAPGGWLLWGEPFWKAEPSPPFRQIIELTNLYETNQGWQDAAVRAGFEVASARVSTEAEHSHYVETMDRAVRDWAAMNPDRPETPGLIARADMQKAVFGGEAARCLGFGLYLLRNRKSLNAA